MEGKSEGEGWKEGGKGGKSRRERREGMYNRYIYEKLATKNYYLEKKLTKKNVERERERGA